MRLHYYVLIPCYRAQPDHRNGKRVRIGRNGSHLSGGPETADIWPRAQGALPSDLSATTPRGRDARHHELFRRPCLSGADGGRPSDNRLCSCDIAELLIDRVGAATAAEAAEWLARTFPLAPTVAFDSALVDWAASILPTFSAGGRSRAVTSIDDGPYQTTWVACRIARPV